MKTTRYKYGEPIPKKYRERLYDWDGGGYDGFGMSPLSK